MPVVNELRSVSSFPGEPRVGIRRRGVSVVGALLSLKVGLLVLAAGPGSRWILVILALEALLAGPRFDERAIHGEVLAREKLFLLGLLQDLLEELPGDLLFEESFPVLGKRSGMPDLVVHSQPYEPPKEQVVVELLHQHSLAPDAVEHLQKQSSQESFGRYGRPAHLGVHLLEVRAQTFEGLVDHLPHL